MEQDIHRRRCNQSASRNGVSRPSELSFLNRYEEIIGYDEPFLLMDGSPIRSPIALTGRDKRQTGCIQSNVGNNKHLLKAPRYISGSDMLEIRPCPITFPLIHHHDAGPTMTSMDHLVIVGLVYHAIPISHEKSECKPCSHSQ